MQFDQGIVYEITKYLSKGEWLSTRLVFRIPHDINGMNMTSENAIILASREMFEHKLVLTYQYTLHVSKYRPDWAHRYTMVFANKISSDDLLICENAIARSARWSIEYKKCNKSWTLGDRIIADDPIYSKYSSSDIMYSPGSAAFMLLDGSGRVSTHHELKLINGRYMDKNDIYIDNGEKYVYTWQ